MLLLKNIHKSYHTEAILEIPFLQLESGIYWIKGANGSGKTTLLKMIAGLIPFDGDISFKEISLKSKPLMYRQIVSWAEAEPLFPEFMTGMDLIMLYRSIRKSPQSAADELIGLFKMTEYVHHAVGTYSAGMTKKLSLVLAFLGNTPLTILDEPLITLDPDALTIVCNFILQKHNHNGTSFLLSSHQELDTALLLSGKELVVKNRSVF